MKNRIHKSLDRLLEDRYVGTKISLFVSVKGDLPAHMLFTSLCESAIRLLPDEHVANSFRRWIQMIRDDRHAHKGARTIALFFSETVREVIYLDREIPSRVVVAQSWHVKPLLYVADSRPWGHILEFNDSGISIIRSDGETHELMETLLAPVSSPLPSKSWPDDLDCESLRTYINRAATRIPEGTLVQISGAPDGFARSAKYWQHFWTTVHVDESILGGSERQKHIETFSRILSLQKKDFEPSDILKELSGASVISDPALIARRIVEGKVLRIFISLEAIQWGEMDPASGTVKKSKVQTNHIDEDVLDDIAELALKSGVEVRILRQSSFPGNFEILAA
jgi:hypothetical protein